MTPRVTQRFVLGLLLPLGALGCTRTTQIQPSAPPPAGADVASPPRDTARQNDSSSATDSRLPPPVAPVISLPSCQQLQTGQLQDTVESSGLAPLPGLKSPAGLPLLVTHGDNELYLDIVDPSGEQIARVEVRGAGDYEAITLLRSELDGEAHSFEFVAIRSPGNYCVRGQGSCTDGAFVRFTLQAQAGRFSLLGSAREWRLPAAWRTNTEALQWTGSRLLAFAKNTGDKLQVHLEPGATEARMEPLVEQGNPGQQGLLTDLTVHPNDGRLLATSCFPPGDHWVCRLVEFDATTLALLRITELTEAFSLTQVEALSFLPDASLVVTNEDGSIARFRCP